MIGLLFFALTAILDGAHDTLDDFFSTSIFAKWGNWWDQSVSWRFKWKNGDRTQGERFPGSSTIFCWFTDGWHLVKGMKIACIIVAVNLHSAILPWWWADILLYPLTWLIFFELSYRFCKKQL